MNNANNFTNSGLILVHYIISLNDCLILVLSMLWVIKNYHTNGTFLQSYHLWHSLIECLLSNTFDLKCFSTCCD